MWLILAICSALLVGVGSVFSKVGVSDSDADCATGFRFSFIFIVTWIAAFFAEGCSLSSILEISARDWLFLVLSGFAMGASWICYFKALSIGDVTRVVPVDKLSVVMSMLLGFTVLHEQVTWVKIVCMLMIGFGNYLMFPRKGEKLSGGRSWVVYALMSALGAALMSTLSKFCSDSIGATLGTAIRTTIVLPLAWLIPVMSGQIKNIGKFSKRSMKYTMISGLATAASWVCFYAALAKGPSSVVTPIEKLNMVVSLILSYFIFKERLSRKMFIAAVLITLGTLLNGIVSLIMEVMG